MWELILGIILIIAIPIGGLFVWLGTRLAKVQKTSFKKSILVAIVLTIFVAIIWMVDLSFHSHFKSFNFIPTFPIALCITSYFVIKIFFKTTLRQTFLVLLFSIVPLVLAVPLIMFGGVALSFMQINRQENKMQRPEAYTPVLETMALYCQSLPEGLKIYSYYNAISDCRWIPESIKEMKPNSVSLDNNYASIGFGGGFYGWGYIVKKQEGQSMLTENIWSIELRREDKEDLLLTTITLDASKRINTPEWTDMITKEQEKQQKEKTDSK